MVEISSIKPPEDSTEETLEGSDMDTTVVDKEGSLVKSLGAVQRDGELKTLSDDGSGNLQRSVVRTLRYGTPPPTLSIGSITTKLMFRLSRSLDNMNSTVTDDMMTNRSGLGLGYINNEFYLPIAGCPGVSELEPQLTDQLTLKGNKPKLLHVPLWNHTYYTNTYMIDDVPGELYACHQDELIAIKEQGYLQKEMADKKYLHSQDNKKMTNRVQSSGLQVASTAFKNDPNMSVASGS